MSIIYFFFQFKKRWIEAGKQSVSVFLCKFLAWEMAEEMVLGDNIHKASDNFISFRNLLSRSDQFETG